MRPSAPRLGTTCRAATRTCARGRSHRSDRAPPHRRRGTRRGRRRRCPLGDGGPPRSTPRRSRSRRLHLRVCPGDGDARAPLPAGHIGHPGRRIGAQAGVDLGYGREPLRAEQLFEHRPGERRLALVEIGAVTGIRNTRASPDASTNHPADGCRRPAAGAGAMKFRLAPRAMPRRATGSANGAPRPPGRRVVNVEYLPAPPAARAIPARSARPRRPPPASRTVPTAPRRRAPDRGRVATPRSTLSTSIDATVAWNRRSTSASRRSEAPGSTVTTSLLPPPIDGRHDRRGVPSGRYRTVKPNEYESLSAGTRRR